MRTRPFRARRAKAVSRISCRLQDLNAVRGEPLTCDVEEEPVRAADLDQLRATAAEVPRELVDDGAELAMQLRGGTVPRQVVFR